MRNAVLIFLLPLAAVVPVIAQTDASLAKYLDHLPDLKLSEPTPQRYLVTSDYINLDIFGNFINKTRVEGEYTRGYQNGDVRWNHVQIASASTREGLFLDWAPQDYMENFTYSPQSNLMDAAAFPSFPPGSFQAKNLVWDVLTLEIVAWSYFDSLQLNKSYRPTNINGAVPLAGEGTFENRDFQIIWTGISKMNEEYCLLIEFRAFDNPLVVDTEQLKLRGRSHYWGEVWISLKDKQIEHAVLYEDVVMKMNLNGMKDEQLLDARREIIVEKQ